MDDGGWAGQGNGAACRPPGEWQRYDIVWEGPKFESNELVKPAFITVVLNGVVLHHRTELMGTTSHRVLTTYDLDSEVGPLELQSPGHSPPLDQVRLDSPRRAKQAEQDVEEVDPDVHGQAAGSLLGAFPRHVVPRAATRHVGKLDVVPMVRASALDLPLQGDDRRMISQLQDGVHPAPEFPLQLADSNSQNN